MNKSFRILVLLALCTLFVSCAAPRGLVSSTPKKSPGRLGIFSVRAFGATGDGTNKDTVAFQEALDACEAAGGGKVFVTNGFYLIGSIVIGGNTTLQLADHANLIGSPDIGDYPLMRIRWEGEFAQGHRALIFSEKSVNVAVTGHGAIFGPPINVSRLRNPRGPTLIEFSECTNVTLENFSTEYEHLWSIHPVLCQKFTARNLLIRSINSNGDGIDVDSCSNVLIGGCDIDTGDDAISLKSGRGEAAIALARPTQDVVITNCTLVSSQFAAIGVGTELSGGIRNVRVENCFISGRQNAFFLKSRGGRGGFIENFTGENLTINDSPTFLGINLLNKGVQGDAPVTNGVVKWTRVNNLRFSNVLVENVGNLVLAQDIPREQPVDGLSISNLMGTCGHAFRLANMTNVTLAAIKVTGYRGAFMTRTNVQGSGLEAPKKNLDFSESAAKDEE
jgi:polygalacturonase